MIEPHDRADSPGVPAKRSSPRWLKVTIGSMLAFIAGMAVMLAVLLPFIPRNDALTALANPHAGMGSLTVQGNAAQKCLSCHTSTPAAPAR